MYYCIIVLLYYCIIVLLYKKMQRLKHFAIGFSVGMSGVIFGCILGLGITLYQKRIDIKFTKK